jgi:hypothetical protein
MATIGRASSGIHEWVRGAGVLIFFVARMAVAGAWEVLLGNAGLKWLLYWNAGNEFARPFVV